MSSNGFSPYSRDGQRDPLAKNLLAPGLPRGDDQASPDATGNIGISQAFILREFERASLRLVERRFETGDVIYAPGDSDDRLYFLLSGAIRIYRPYGCFKEATTALLVDEGVFGRLDLPEAGSQEGFAEALTGARVAQLRKASVVWLVKRRPEV